MKKAMIAEAEGKQKAIELSGAITEYQKALIEADVMKAEKVSASLSKINVPKIMFMGDNNGKGGQDTIMTNLINLKLMESVGILDVSKVGPPIVETKE